MENHLNVVRSSSLPPDLQFIRGKQEKNPGKEKIPVHPKLMSSVSVSATPK